MTYKSSLADIFEMKFEKTANQYELVSTAFPELSKAQKDDYENVRKEYAHRLKTISDSFRETEWIYIFESKIPNLYPPTLFKERDFVLLQFLIRELTECGTCIKIDLSYKAVCFP